MDSARWQRIQSLFHAAVDLSAEDRRAYLNAECAGDSELMAKVIAMLEEDARGASVLDRDVAQVAHEMLASGAHPSLPLKEFGPYRIQRVLGEGGMGIVYLAEREDLKTLVAIKILRDAWLSPARRERFASEQRTLAQLNHPSIARLYDADTLQDGTPWFVMEYVEGLSLTAYCREHDCSIRERLELFRQVCEAVQFAHRHAVIHRDLKPSNILVRSDGAIRLLDFGIAKQLEALDLSADQTQTELRLMTPAYAAPEQVRGERVGIYTDVYALGVVLYELLAGKVPFNLSNRTPGEAETIIVQQEPEKPSAAAKTNMSPQVSGKRSRFASQAQWADLDVLCLTTMHKDIQRRYRSVEGLIRDVDHYLKGEPLEALPDNLRYRFGKFIRRNRRAVGTAAMVSLFIVGLVIFYTLRLATAWNAAQAEAARTHRIQQFMLNLFEGGDKEAGPPDSLRVVTMVDRGVQEARALDREPRVQAELFQTLGNIYEKLGKFDEAESLLQSALKQRQTLFGQDNSEVASSLVALGLLRTSQARYDEAEQMVRQALEMSRRHLPANHPAIARAVSALGRIFEDRGMYEKAIPLLEEAVQLQSAATSDSTDLATSLTELANCHFYSGHYAISESLNRRVIEMDRQIFGENHPHVADDLINLGAVQFEQGQYPESENFYRQALGIIQGWYGKDHQETASALTMLGRALVAQSHADEAGQLLQEALRIQQRVYGPVHPRVASALNELGLVALKQGKLDEAQSCFTRMADIYRSVYDDKHYVIGIALANLASVYVEKKQYAKAEGMFQEVLQRYSETLPPDHQYVGIARIRLGRALVRDQRYREAEGQTHPGYEILMKLKSPPERWLKMAREDLLTIYNETKQPDKATIIQSQIAKAAQSTSLNDAGRK
jgi:serine/threonine-protein kinase